MATLVLGGFFALAKGHYRPRTVSLGTTAKPAPTGQTSTPARAPAAASPPPLPSGAVRLGPTSRLRTDQAATYRDPADGHPDLVIRHRNGALTAMTAVCTHAGCTVGYEGGQIVCPCHGATYDAQTGQPLSGPAQGPLTNRRVVEQGGSIYSIPS